MKAFLQFYTILSVVIGIVTLETLGLIDSIRFGYDSDKLVRTIVRALCYYAIIYFVMSGPTYKITYTKI